MSDGCLVGLSTDMFTSVDKDRLYLFVLSAVPLTLRLISEMEEKRRADDFHHRNVAVFLSAVRGALIERAL